MYKCIMMYSLVWLVHVTQRSHQLANVPSTIPGTYQRVLLSTGIMSNVLLILVAPSFGFLEIYSPHKALTLLNADCTFTAWLN